jgi:hypothetical protein
MKVKVEVTPQHITYGVYAHYYNWPVALAIKDKLPKTHVTVGMTCLSLRKRGNHTVVDLPRSAHRFIKKFEKTYDGKPFRFTLTVPTEFV